MAWSGHWAGRGILLDNVNKCKHTRMLRNKRMTSDTNKRLGIVPSLPVTVDWPYRLFLDSWNSFKMKDRQQYRRQPKLRPVTKQRPSLWTSLSELGQQLMDKIRIVKTLIAKVLDQLHNDHHHRDRRNTMISKCIYVQFKKNHVFRVLIVTMFITDRWLMPQHLQKATVTSSEENSLDL